MVAATIVDDDAVSSDERDRRVRVTRRQPTDEIPAPLATRAVLLAEGAQAVFIDRCRRWTDGISFYVTVVLASPLQPRFFEDDEFFDQVPDFRGEPLPNSDQQVTVLLSADDGTRLTNDTKAGTGHGLILIGSSGSRERWEAQYWAEQSGSSSTNWLVEVIWPGQQLHCSTTLSSIANSVGDPVRLTPGP